MFNVVFGRVAFKIALEGTTCIFRVAPRMCMACISVFVLMRSVSHTNSFESDMQPSYACLTCCPHGCTVSENDQLSKGSKQSSEWFIFTLLLYCSCDEFLNYDPCRFH